MEKVIGPIKRTLEANLDLNYRLTLTQFKQETLFATVGERVGWGSDNAGRIWATRNSFPPTAKEHFPRLAHEYLDKMDCQW